MRDYSHGHHTMYHHRYHLVWITKYRYRVLRGKIGSRVHDIIAQIAEKLGVQIINSVVSAEHFRLLVSISPHVSVSEFVKKAKGWSSRKIQQEYTELRKQYWGRHFWERVF